MYAVVRTGGKQYRVEEGFEILIEKLEGVESGQPVQLSDVLLVSDGKGVEVGKPKLSASVQCLCVEAMEKGPKLRTIKYKRRHNYKRTMGHRQQYTRLLVQKIDGGKSNGSS